MLDDILSATTSIGAVMPKCNIHCRIQLFAVLVLEARRSNKDMARGAYFDGNVGVNESPTAECVVKVEEMREGTGAAFNEGDDRGVIR